VPAATRVLIVEDNQIFRETLELLLGLRPDVDVVGSIATGTEAPDVAARTQPDVVLMDYRMPGLNGAQATRAVLEACPTTNVVCLSASISRKEQEELVAAGAVACITKEEELEVIVSTITSAASAGAAS
jgi:DNA-binding NarL/FixJ family response regulator